MTGGVGGGGLFVSLFSVLGLPCFLFAFCFWCCAISRWGCPLSSVRGLLLRHSACLIEARCAAPPHNRRRPAAPPLPNATSKTPRKATATPTPRADRQFYALAANSKLRSPILSSDRQLYVLDANYKLTTAPSANYKLKTPILCSGGQLHALLVNSTI